MTKILSSLISAAIVAFGQPAYSNLCGILSASCGYGIFWLTIDTPSSKKKIFSSAFCWHFVINTVQFSWFLDHEISSPAISLTFLAISIALSCEFAAFSLFLKSTKFSKVISSSSLWMLVELSRLFVLSGFSWNPMGMALASTTYGSQLASLGGVYLLSFITCSTNVLFVVSLKKKKFKTYIFTAMFPYIFGILYINLFPKTSVGDIPITIVDTSYPATEKYSIDPIKLWRQAISKLPKMEEGSLTIFPEGFAQFPLNSTPYTKEDLKDIFDDDDVEKYYKETFSDIDIISIVANRNLTDVILGGEKDGENVAIFFSRERNKWYKYAKRILVPMGESIPFSWQWVKNIAKKYGVTDSFVPGDCATIFPAKIPCGISICYEETFGYIVKESVSSGGKFLVNITNDGWWKYKSSLKSQHLEHARLRAIENGMPLVRACNQGISAIVDNYGRNIVTLGKYEENSLNAMTTTLSITNIKTLYSIYGDHLTIIVALLLAIIEFIVTLKRKKKPQFYENTKE